MFGTKRVLGLAMMAAGLVAEAQAISAQSFVAVPRAPMTVPLYAYGPMIGPPQRYRQQYWSRYPRYFGQDNTARAPTYRYGRAYGSWQRVWPYAGGYRGTPFYRYRWTERRALGDSPRFTARILRPQARPGLHISAAPWQ